MVRLQVRDFFSKTGGESVAEVELQSKIRRLLGGRYQVVTHRDANPAVLPGVGAVPPDNHQRGFRNENDARDYFEFCVWKLNSEISGSTEGIRHLRSPGATHYTQPDDPS